MSKYLGDVSAYAYAVSKGYTGTEEEFAELMASYATVAEAAAESAEQAASSASAASGSANTANTAAQTATTKANEASQSATNANQSATQASGSATTAQGAAQTATAKANEASASAATALQQAQNAMTHASNAQTFANNAQTSATQAAASANTANDSANLAVEAKDTAVASSRAVLINEETEAANPLVITDGGDGLPVKDCTVNIQPNQPNAYDSVWVGGAGKNMLPFNLDDMKSQNVGGTWADNRYTYRGITFTVNDDGTIIVNGTATEYGIFMFTTYKAMSDYGIVANTQYVISGGYGSASLYLMFGVSGSGQEWRDTTGNGETMTPSDVSKLYRPLIMFTANASVSNVVIKPMLRIATASSTFEPYSNICPISGWTEANIRRTGKNLNPNEGVNYTTQSSQRFFMKAGNYVFSTDNGANIQSNPYIQLEDENGNVITKGGITSAYLSLNSTELFYYGGYGRSEVPFTLNKDAYMRIGFNNTIPSNFNALQIEVGNAKTAYEPYTGTTYSVDLSSAGTVYGGTLDVTTGVLTVDRAMVTFDGSQADNDFTYATGRITWNGYANVGAKGTNDFKSNALTASPSLTVSPAEWQISNATDTAYARMFIGIPTSIDSLNAWKAYVTETPIQVVYPLLTPITYQLTPTEVTTLLKNNTLTANCGTVSLSYYADTKSYIDNAIATAVASL